jgi:phosphotransferase system HPr (HPr) family protein
VPEAPAGTSAVADAVVINPQGIHARPSHAIVLAAQDFAARIELEHASRRADARSILSVMTLGVPCGGRVTVHAQGPDAQRAVAAIVAILVRPESR